MNADNIKDLVRSYAQMWNEHKPELAEQILAQNYIDHAHPEVVGPAAVAEIIGKTLQSMPDFHIEVQSIIAEGDLAAFRETITMTRGEKQRELQGMSFVRVAGDKLVERWTCYESNDD